MFNPVIYVFLNKSLHMSVGKATAQGIHAGMLGAMGSDIEFQKVWHDSMHKTVIVLEARDQAHIKNIYGYLLMRGILAHEVIDEGVNEIDPHTTTALASNILDKDNEDIIKAFSTFKLYRDLHKITVEFEK